MHIEAGKKALIRGGIFTVVGRPLGKEGHWQLEMDTKIVRKKRVVYITIPDAEVEVGMQEYQAEMAVRECARTESPERTMARLRFLPTKC